MLVPNTCRRACAVKHGSPAPTTHALTALNPPRPRRWLDVSAVALREQVPRINAPKHLNQPWVNRDGALLAALAVPHDEHRRLGVQVDVVRVHRDDLADPQPGKGPEHEHQLRVGRRHRERRVDRLPRRWLRLALRHSNGISAGDGVRLCQVATSTKLKNTLKSLL